MSDQADDEQWLIEEDVSEASVVESTGVPWHVLIVDDEPDIHSVTRIALGNLVYKDRPLLILSAFSAKEGLMMLRNDPDIALVLLDVVMETDDAGLRMARQIREDIQNPYIRIVLRTGQPGQAPERDIILQYDINDYKSKTELTSQKLFTTVISSLRAYEGLIMIERSRQGLERILEASTDLYHVRSLREFASGVLNQISAILDVGTDGVLCLLRQNAANEDFSPIVVAATGSYSHLANADQELLDSAIWQSARKAFQRRENCFEHPLDVLYVGTPEQREFVIVVSPPRPLIEFQKNLLNMFCSKIGWAFDNLHQFDAIRQQQESISENIRRLLFAIQNGEYNDMEALVSSLVAQLNQAETPALDAAKLVAALASMPR